MLPENIVKYYTKSNVKCTNRSLVVHLSQTFNNVNVQIALCIE